MSPKTFTATEALAAFRRVKLTSGSGTAVEYADQADSNAFVGITKEDCLITEQIAVELKGYHRTFKCVAADTFSAGATLYAAADGKVSDSASGNAIGTALEACTGAGDIVEILLDEGAASAPSPTTIANDADAVGIPFIIHAVCVAAGAEDEVVIAATPRKALIIDAWMIARDTNAANVTLKEATNAFTAAVAKGTANNAIVSFGTIIAAYDEPASGDAIIATFSAAGAADIFILCLPIA